MCFKKPKAPPKSAEQIAQEKELEELRKVRQAQLNREMSEQKDRRVEDAIARAAGFMGNRSLIKGGKGGAGFLGAYSRKSKKEKIGGRNKVGSGIVPSPAPPIMASILGGGSSSGGSLFSYYGGGGGGGTRTDSYMQVF